MGVDPQPRVFLSYRRREDQHFIGRIHDRLVAEFGEENVFRDVESIGGAENFLAAITNRLAESDILLSVIGPQWSLGPTAGQRDWVHVELERALERQMLVIPVCLDSTPVPSRDSLPPAIQGLVDVNALWIDGTNHFASDMAKLTRLIRTEVAARRAALTARHALHRVVFVRDSPEPPQSARSSGGRSRKRWAVPAIAAAVARCSAWVSNGLTPKSSAFDTAAAFRTTTTAGSLGSTSVGSGAPTNFIDASDIDHSLNIHNANGRHSDVYGCPDPSPAVSISGVGGRHNAEGRHRWQLPDHRRNSDDSVGRP
jgi:hypothetical protein